MSSDNNISKIFIVGLSIDFSFCIYRLKEKAWTEELPPLPPNGILDPVLIDPLGRTRLKKLKTRPWTPGKPQV